MRPFGLGLLAALIVALMAPAVAMAAKAPASAVSPEARKVGMADAPALVAAASLPCKVTDARLVGKAPPDKKTGSLGSSLYEVACEGAPGFLVQTTSAAPNAFSCVLVNYPADPAQKAPNPCMLPGNTDLMPAITALLTKAKVNCVPEGVRGIGQTAHNTLVEVSCSGGVGYVLTASSPLDVSKDATATNCLAYDAAQGNIKCILAEPATRLAVVNNYAKLANNCCTVKDKRFVGMFTDGTEGYEVACADGKGYIYKVSQGTVKETLDCAKVPGASKEAFNTAANDAKVNCPISRLLKAAEITLDAQLV